MVRKMDDFVHTSTLPVSDDRPALDFFVNDKAAGACRLYHFRSQRRIFRDAFDVT